MAEGAGAFVARSFDRMIKDASAKKFADLHKALVAYTEESKIPQVIQSTPAPVEVSSVEVSTSEVSDDGVLSKAVEIEAEPSSVEAVEDVAIEQLPTSPPSEPSTEATMSLPSKPLTEATMSPPSKPLTEATTSPPSKPATEATVKENASLTTSAILSKAGLTLEGPQAELVLLPLRLAFETKQPKFVEPALDCLHKLISYENLEGDAGLEGGKNAETSTELFNMVCACADGNASDSTVLQVMKVLLTAVASNKFRVHGECLLSSIRTCYNIILTSKSPINQATAKGTLTQMISIILKRMETETQIAEITRGSSGDVAKSNYGDENGSSTQENSAMDLSSVPEDETQSASVTVEELQHLAGDADIKGLEAALGKAVHPEGGRKMPEGLDLDSMTLAQRNALLVFRTLCKMCMKEENDDVVNKTKSLSLELLQGLLESVSHSFTQNFHFIDSVKAYLCYALLRSCVSSTASIFQLATAIFSVLLLRFRESLKAEIGVFFPLIILRSLDSSDTHLHQRLAVLKLLERVCKDPQMLADVFANYDCDLEAANLFERMASSLSRMAQGTLNADPSNISLAQNSSIKGSALQCLVSVLRSLVDWAKTHDFNRKTSRGVGIEETSHGSSHEMVSDGRSNEDPVGHVDQFEKAKAHKSILEAAVLEFNRKPEKGIEFLVANKLVENNPTVIAQFLHSTPGLDMQMIGDYLGQFEEFPLAVMHAYVDAMSFKGMKFDVAIREFLKGFRLPGEAQKIDRIMEKFAERYCCENPGLFKSADAAYVLAYAVIMLNTDAHNPMVWPKMTKADFVRMNAGTESYEGVPEDLLSEIYDSIVKDEIKMKEESRSSGKGSRQSDERSRLMRVLNLGLTQRKSVADAKKESEEIVRRTQALFRKGGVKKGVFYMAKQMELVRPMLEAVGWPLLAAFSVTIEDGDNKSQVALCMEGFKLGIHLGKVLGMDTLRYAFLTSLVRFTYLHAPKEMRNKNVEALRTLLNLSENEPDALQDTWNAVLECVSRLEYITSNPSISITLMQGSNQISRDALTHALNELMGKPTEQVFVNSVRLPSDAIVEFFTALCGVSAEELKQNPPRVFSLQKLVEISYYNMARIRMVWAKIWLLLSQHFVSAGSHHDEKIAMYAIDSLRQLGIKYLERSELANFTFQNDILKPFVVLMRTSQRSSIRALIVDCIIQMVKSKVGSIKSGWKSVFMVFKAAALDQTESIAETAFENMEQVVLEHFDQVVGDCFMDCVHCLIAFANNKCIPRISLKSIALLRICEDRLAEGMIPGGISTPIELENVDSHFDVGEHYWFPMLVGLSELTSDLRTEVRNCALEVLFDLLMERGHKFSPSFWKNVFSDVLFPIFDHIRDAGKDIEKSTHADLDLRETCIHSLKLLCNLFSTFYKEVSFVLPSLLGLLLDCATRADQTLASISVGALTHLIEVGGSHFNEKDWSTLLESIRDACYTTQPVELLNSSNLSDYGSSSRTLSTRASLLYSNGEQAPEITVDHGDGLESHGNGFSFGEVLRIASDNESPVLGRQSEAWETESKGTTIFSEGGNSSIATGTSESQSGGFFSSQSFGRKIMGNMMDTILLRNITFKPKAQYSEISTPAILEQISDFDQQELLVRGDEASVPPSVRSKCIVQLLFLGTLDSLQRKHWNRLQLSHKTTIMDILLSMVDFAGSYNSYINLRNRLQQFSGERPPANLLRQEIEGTRIYLTVLLQCTTKVEQAESSKGFENGILNMDNSNDSGEACRTMEEKFYELGEERLCSFCSHVLKEAADIQPSIGDAVEYDLHYALSLRSPVVIKVIDGLREMEMGTFRKHLPEFYPYFTKLIRCEQVDVRRSLCDLFKVQLVALLP